MVLMVGALLAVIPVPATGIVLEVPVAWLGFNPLHGKGRNSTTALQRKLSW